MRHYVGELSIISNPRALELVSSAPPPGVFTFSEYLEACKRADALHTKKLREEREVITKGIVVQSLLTRAERTFLKGKHEPTPDGYARYRAPLDLEFSETIDRAIKVYIPERARLEHTFIAGSPGRGKTELFKTLIYSYVTQPGCALVVLDPHGEYSEEIAHWPEFAGKPRLVYFDARLHPDYLPCINPFELPENAGTWEKQVTAQELSEAFGEILGTGEGTDLSAQMETLLLSCILVLLDYPNVTLRHVRDLINGDETLLRHALSRHEYPDAVEYFKHDFCHKTRDSTKRSISSKISHILSTGIFADLTCHPSTIHLEREINRKRVLVFNLAGIGKTEGPAFGRMLMAMLQSIAMRRERIPKHKRTVTHIFADEIQRLVSPSIGVILSEARKFRMILTMAQPVIGAGMSTELKKIVLEAPNCIISARCQPPAAAEAARLVNCDPKEIEHLPDAEFMIRMGRQRPFRFHNRSDLVGDKHSMSPELWTMVRLRQCWTYYRRTEHLPIHETVDVEPEISTESEDSIFGTL